MKLTILASSLIALLPLVLAESLKPCGSARYYPSKYTCFGTQLCPKTSTGEATITCGPACYDAGTYYCDAKTQLQLITPDSAVQYCGTAPYRPGAYTCWGGNFLCPVLNGEATLACGGTACYNPREYTCTDGKLGSPAEVPPPTCNGLYGEFKLNLEEGTPACTDEFQPLVAIMVISHAALTSTFVRRANADRSHSRVW